MTRAVLFLSIFLSVQLSGQQVTEMRLAPANARIDHGFTYIRSIRELVDGRVLVFDLSEPRFVLADLGANTITPVSRVGQGPLEYRCGDTLWALGGDSTVFSGECRNSLVLEGARPVTNWTLTNSPIMQATNRAFEGADQLGHLAISLPLRPDMARNVPFDSIWVGRYDRKTSRIDTLTAAVNLRPGYYSWLQRARGVTTGGGGGGGGGSGESPPGMLLSVSLHELDAIAMSADGWVAIARFNPYRVDWCPVAGRCSTGPVLEERPTYTEAEKRAYIKAMHPTQNISLTSGWPPTIPPFGKRRNITVPVLAIPDGRLLIERTATISRPANSYDIVDRRGIIVARISLPIEHRIVGFGARSVYTATKDRYDVERIQRHPWP